MNSQRFNYDEVKSYIESLDRGYILLSTEYINARTKLDIRCKNNHVFKKTLDSLKRSGTGCPHCSGLAKYTFAQIKKYIDEDSGSNYKLLSTEYENRNTLLTIQCDNGHIYQTKFTLFKNHEARCRKCFNKRTSERLSYSFEYAKRYVEIDSDSGFVLLEDKYINSQTPMKMMCKNGHISEKAFSNFISGNRCWTCHVENNRGENNPNWNYELNEEDRLGRRHVEGYSNWIYSVYQRDRYICQCCGKKSDSDMNAHHMDGYNWCKERRLDVANGVTLCGGCHTSFHQTYGYGDNTEDQFLYWIIQNGIGIYNIDEKRKASVLLSRPKPKDPYDKKEYFRKYYEENSRKYSEEDFDNIFDELALNNTAPKYFTMFGFRQMTGIHPISATGVLNMSWINVLERYGIKEIVYKYVCDEYHANYLRDYKCSFEQFTKSHEYITQDLIKQFTMSKIKQDCGFTGSFQQHNFLGLETNFIEIKNALGRIPFLNEFIKLTKITISSYYSYFDTTSYDQFISKFSNIEQELNEYEKNKVIRVKQIASIGGRNSGYSEEEKEQEFRRVFDDFFSQFGRYPTRREFNDLSTFSEKAYMKKYKRSWKQAVQYYGYSTPSMQCASI